MSKLCDRELLAISMYESYARRLLGFRFARENRLAWHELPIRERENWRVKAGIMIREGFAI